MLVTVPELKQYLAINGLKTDDDAKLFECLQAADKHFKELCQRDFEVTSYTEYYDGDGTDTLYVDNFPIVSITSIHDDLDLEYNAEDLIAAADRMTYADEGKIELDETVFQAGSQNIKIVYSAGFAVVPADIKLAVKLIAVAMYMDAQGSIQVVEGTEYLYKPAILRKEAQKIIDYRRRVK